MEKVPEAKPNGRQGVERWRCKRADKLCSCIEQEINYNRNTNKFIKEENTKCEISSAHGFVVEKYFLSSVSFVWDNIPCFFLRLVCAPVNWFVR